MPALTRLRQLAWTALVIAPGFVATGCTPVTGGTTVRQPGGAAELPPAVLRKASAASSAPAAASAVKESWPWSACEDNPWRELEELEDEFDGRGWGFWPS